MMKQSSMMLLHLFQKRNPTVKYFRSVCTGSAMIATASILDGRKAKSTKCAWSFGTSDKDVNWVRKARWVVDSNIWSSSNVPAGMDTTYAFISIIFSPNIAKELANMMEYESHTNSE
jgi:transcriptional regulator GlxA family with amidase domain